MILFCPACGHQHVDRVTEQWANPPHRSHQCEHCKLVWRPADVPTNGVERIATSGKADTWPASSRAAAATGADFQSRVAPWMLETFGSAIASDARERNERFLEESLELVQACGISREACHRLVDYVFGRPLGEPVQEVGGVMVTLAALCLAQGLDMAEAGETELARIWTLVEEIREKQHGKPALSAQPGVYPGRQ
jgi:hypothetical protein